MDITDAEMQDAGRLLSLLGSKRHLEAPEEETVVFSTNTDTEGNGSPLVLSGEETPKGNQIEAEGQNDLRVLHSPPTNPYPTSILRNRGLKSVSPAIQPRTEPAALPFKNLVKVSMILMSEDAATECHKILAHLFTQLLDVDDQAAILPIDLLSSLDPIRMVPQLPSNWTKLGKFIYLKGGAYSFRSRTAQTGGRKHPEPWLVFCLASQKDTSYLLQSVSVEFEWVNRRTIRVKSCQSFNSYTPLMFPFLFNKAHLPSLIVQLQDLMADVKAQMTQLCLLDEEDQERTIPEFNLRVNNPRLPYQSMPSHKKFDSFTSQNKRIVHLECCETATTFILQLFKYIKENGLMHQTFGKYVHVTKPLTSDACGQDCNLLRRMAQLHTNFHNSVQLHSINGIVNISATASMGKVTDGDEASFLPLQSFRDILYSLRLPDKSPLFLSILPRPGGSVVNCVIPNTLAAETRLVQMNQHLPGYLKHYLWELGYNQDGIVDLLNRACDPDLTSTISELTWDPKHKVVILPSEAATGVDLDEMEQEPWMQQMSPSSNVPFQSSKRYNDPDHAFPLSSDISVTTIHANKPTDKIATPPPSHISTTPNSPSKEVVIIDPNTQDDVSTLSTMSKNDLIKMLLHLHRNNQNLSGLTGFAPDREVSPHAGPAATGGFTERTPGIGGSPGAVAMGK